MVTIMRKNRQGQRHGGYRRHQNTHAAPETPFIIEAI
jgi:chloramphenicol 3-O-phosphotransferase